MGVVILIVASCYGSRVKLQPCRQPPVTWLQLQPLMHLSMVADKCHGKTKSHGRANQTHGGTNQTCGILLPPWFFTFTMGETFFVCREIGLFCPEFGLFYREISWFCCEFGLFCHEIGLLCREIWFCCQWHLWAIVFKSILNNNSGILSSTTALCKLSQLPENKGIQGGTGQPVSLLWSATVASRIYCK